MNRQGEYKINLSGVMAYKSFCPSPLSPTPPLIFDEGFSSLLAKASSSVAKLDGYQQEYQVSHYLFLSMCLRRLCCPLKLKVHKQLLMTF